MAETLQFSGGKTYGNKWVNGLVFWEKPTGNHGFYHEI
jgi:hypothetical protein